MEVSNYLVSWVVTYLGDLQPTYIGVIIQLPSTMDIQVLLPYSLPATNSHSLQWMKISLDVP